MFVQKNLNRVNGYQTVELGIPILSGLAVATVNWWQHHKADRLARKAERLRAQLDRLYGPLCYLVSHNAKLAEHHGDLQEAYRKIFEQKKFSEDEKTQMRVKKDVEAALSVMNRYISLMIENNRRIAALLKDNYAYIDHDDADAFHDLILHSLRWEIETSKGETEDSPLPHQMTRSVKRINLYSQDFVDQVRDKFHQKMDQFQSLSS